jgi:uncharacterized membrane protein
MKKFLKEALLIVLVFLPYVYLYTVWNQLAERLPIHFDFNGTPNDWVGKTTMLYIPGSVGLGVYLLMLLIPFIDPKRKIMEMGGKYYSLRFMLTLFISMLLTFVIYSGKSGSTQSTGAVMVLVGGLLAVIGNYFQALRPNYFIGIRTPWTLQSEGVWKKTHKLGGRLWMAGGILIVILSFLIHSKEVSNIVFGALLGIMVLWPILYSYFEFRKERNAPVTGEK